MRFTGAVLSTADGRSAHETTRVAAIRRHRIPSRAALAPEDLDWPGPCQPELQSEPRGRQLNPAKERRLRSPPPSLKPVEGQAPKRSPTEASVPEERKSLGGANGTAGAPVSCVEPEIGDLHRRPWTWRRQCRPKQRFASGYWTAYHDCSPALSYRRALSTPLLPYKFGRIVVGPSLFDFVDKADLDVVVREMDHESF
ncbi:hypothetical protein V1277_000901 [Bradyrhizobium sp. AZCC 1588]